MSALAGQIANPDTYNVDTRKLIARARRETDSTAGTTEAGVLRIDGIAVKSGRHYRISTSPLQVNSTVLNDVVTVRIRIATDGTTATTSSTQLDQMTADHNITAGKGWPIITEHTPGADQTCSVLLTVARTSGTGNVKIEGNAVYPICVWVDDMGPDTGDVGIEL
jgi:hypothetical protein